MKLFRLQNENKSKEEQQAKEQLKNMSKKERIAYFWYYYRVHTFVAIALIIALGFFIRDLATKKDVILNVTMINTMAQIDDEKVTSDFLSLVEMDPKDYTVYIDPSPVMNTNEIEPTNVAYVQKLTAMVFARELDVMLLDEGVIDYFLGSNYFGNLEDILSPDTIKAYKDQLLYRDYTDPDTNEVSSIPVAINISSSPKLKEWNVVSTADIYFTILSNSEHMEHATIFFDYLNTK